VAWNRYQAARINCLFTTTLTLLALGEAVRGVLLTLILRPRRSAHYSRWW
jgi:hypothetical protein